MQLYFTVAEQTYCVDFLDDNAPYKQLLPSSAPFYVKAYEGPLMFHLAVGDGLVDADTEGMEEVGHFESGDIWHHVWRKPDGGYKMLIENVDGAIAAHFSTNADFSHCQVSLMGNIAAQSFGLDNCLMIAFAFAGAYHRLLLIHASVPMIEGKAYMFQGKSGTGKSTHSKLWLSHIEGTELLNDDNPAIRVADDGTVYTYGTPWSGKTPCYRPLRVSSGGFLRLHQAPHNKIRQFSKVEAFVSLLSSCSTMVWDKTSYNHICNTVTAIVDRVPGYDLECLPDQAAAQLSFSTMHRRDEQ